MPGQGSISLFVRYALERELPGRLKLCGLFGREICIWPDSSSMQYQLLRSPRSNPTVNFCCEIFLLGFAPAVLTFFIAGLLFICASSTSITWERTASRPETGLLIPSDYAN